MTAREIIHCIGEKEWKDAFKFTFVRNPWDKVVSHYKYRVNTDQNSLSKSTISFNEWVKRTYGVEKIFFYDHAKMFQPQVDWLKIEMELSRWTT